MTELIILSVLLALSGMQALYFILLAVIDKNEDAVPWAMFFSAINLVLLATIAVLLDDFYQKGGSVCT